MSVKKTHKDYVSDLAEKRPTIRVVGRYTNYNEPIEHRCLVCEQNWMGRPFKVLARGNCPECSKRKGKWTKKKTHGQYLLDVQRVHGNKLGITGIYINDASKIGHICNVCNHDFDAKPNNVLNGRGCPVCRHTSVSQKLRETTESFNVRIKLKFEGTVVLLGEYPGARRSKKFQCLICDTTWTTKGNHGCPECSFIRRMSKRFDTKAFSLGKREVMVQGYEPQAISWLLENTSRKPHHISVAPEGNVPVIKYRYKGANRRHYPDIMVEKRDGSKMLLEVKSLFTFGVLSWRGRPEKFYQNKAKLKGARESGYDYHFMVMSSNGLIRLPKDWYKMSVTQVGAALGIKQYKYD